LTTLKAPSAKPQRAGIQVIARAADILRALENEDEGLSLGEIATKVELARSTVQRIVAALADEQLLISASPKSRVKLGPALIRLANATNVEISSIVRPYMEDLSRQIGETIDLSVIQGPAAVFIDQVPGNHRLRAVSAVGERFPLHSTACGKALLATLSEENLAKFLKTELKAFTEHTITSTVALAEQIEAIKRDGISVDVEENTEGICAVGTWINDALGRYYAITIPTPTGRFNRNRDLYSAALIACRKDISLALGDATAR
jgi:DNA-binding IclR family transcriptional regulator